MSSRARRRVLCLRERLRWDEHCVPERRAKELLLLLLLLLSLGRERRERHARGLSLKRVLAHARLGKLWRLYGCGGQDNVGQIVSHADNPLSLAFVARKEFQQILQLTWALLLEEALSTTGFTRMPTELWPTAGVLRLLTSDKRIPCLMNERLVQKSIDNA